MTGRGSTGIVAMSSSSRQIAQTLTRKQLNFLATMGDCELLVGANRHKIHVPQILLTRFLVHASVRPDF